MHGCSLMGASRSMLRLADARYNSARRSTVSAPGTRWKSMVFRPGCSTAPITPRPWYPVAVDHSIRTLAGFRADTASAGAHALDARRVDCTTMIRFAPTRIINIAPLFSGSAPATDRAVAEALSDHGSFVATGFAGAEGFGGRIADLLSFFSMEEAHKLECATSAILILTGGLIC